MKTTAFTSLFTLLAGTLALVAPATVQAASQCEREIYTPETLQERLVDVLPRLGLAMLPSGYTTDVPLPVEPGTDESTITLVRGEEVVAQLTYEDDVITGEQSLLVTDASGALLARADLEFTSCNGAPCREVIFEIARDTASGIDPLRIVYGPFGATDEFAYGMPTTRYGFVTAYRDSLSWLLEVLEVLETGVFVELPPGTDFAYALGTDPYVAPYFTRLTITASAPSAVVSGVVPSNFIHGRVIDVALDLGYYAINPNLIIDTGTQLATTRVPAYYCQWTYGYNWTTWYDFHTPWTGPYWHHWYRWYGWFSWLA